MIGQKGGCDELRAGMHKARIGAVPRQPPLRIGDEIAAALPPCCARARHEQDKRAHPRAIPCLRQNRQRRRSGPDGIGIERGDGIAAQMRQRALDAAAGIKDRGHLDRERDIGVMRGQMCRDLVCAVMGVDRDLAAPCARGCDGMIKKRAARDRDQRFGLVSGQRAHAGAKTGSQDHHIGGHAAAPSAQEAVSARNAATAGRIAAKAGSATARSINAPVRGK